MTETSGELSLATERTTLACWCDGNDCPGPFSETATNACAAPNSPQLSQLVGCGIIAVRAFGDMSAATSCSTLRRTR